MRSRHTSRRTIAAVVLGMLAVTAGPALLAPPAGAASRPTTPSVRSAAATSTGPPASSGSSAPGVTATTITIGQVDDISEPVPGLFRAAEDGTRAYVDYMNAHGGVDGRRLVLDARDSGFSTSTVVRDTEDQASHDFALVGGFSLLDQAEQGPIDRSHVPVVTDPLSATLADDPHLYSPAPSAINATPTGPYLWARHQFPEQSRHMGILYSAATPASTEDELAFDRVMTATGLRYLYRRGIGALETTFTSDVLKMRSAGVTMLYNQELPGSYAATLAKETALAGYHPVNVESIAAYISNMGALGGAAAAGMYIPMPAVLYQGQDAHAVPEVALFDRWVERVDPNVFTLTTPIPALYGWASGMLLVQALRAAGPEPTRASVVAQLNHITSFDAGGLLPPGGDPAHNLPSRCFIVARFERGDWRRVSPSPRTGFICDGRLSLRAGWHPEPR